MATKTGGKHDIPLGVGGFPGGDGGAPCKDGVPLGKKFDIPIQKDTMPFGKGSDYPKGGSELI